MPSSPIKEPRIECPTGVLSKCSAPSGTSVRIDLTTKRGTANSAVYAIRIVRISWSRNANEMFAKLYPVILTDNGTKFSNPAKIEFDDDGSRLSFLFYCNPRASYEKAECERNHVEVRRVLPKGTRYHEATSFNGLSQNDVSLMMSHINSYVRKGINGIPYDLFTKEYGVDIASLFDISRINPNDIILKPSLLGIEVKVKEWVLQD